MKKKDIKEKIENEIFYSKHIMKQMEIECGREICDIFPNSLPPKKQRKEKEFEWERDSER
ncbi:MAG: hypothetical protein WCR30_00870 [Clostridia bacterium]